MTIRLVLKGCQSAAEDDKRPIAAHQAHTCGVLGDDLLLDVAHPLAQLVAVNDLVVDEPDGVVSAPVNSSPSTKQLQMSSLLLRGRRRDRHEPPPANLDPMLQRSPDAGHDADLRLLVVGLLGVVLHLAWSAAFAASSRLGRLTKRRSSSSVN